MTFDKRLTSFLREDARGEVKLIALNRKIESALGHHFIDGVGIRICEAGVYEGIAQLVERTLFKQVLLRL